MGVQRHLPALGCPESWVLRFPSGDANANVCKMCFAIWPFPGRAARRVDDVTLEREDTWALMHHPKTSVVLLFCF